MSDATHHKIRVEFLGFTPLYRLVCEAPADAPCHAAFDCDCEQFYDYMVTREGVPTHLPDPFDKHHWHTGRFDPTRCGLADWFEDDEAIQGEVTFDVHPKWDGDQWIFHTEKQS